MYQLLKQYEKVLGNQSAYGKYQRMTLSPFVSTHPRELKGSAQKPNERTRAPTMGLVSQPSQISPEGGSGSPSMKDEARSPG